MYAIINQNIQQVLAGINENAVIDPYVWMIEMLQDENFRAAENGEFQNIYAQYWKLNGAGLGPDFRAQYFAYLDFLRAHPDQATINNVAQHLYGIPANAAGQHRLHFSFASKLIHMLNTGLPIYDSTVRVFYFLPETNNQDYEMRLANLMESYDFLCEEYARIIDHGLMEHSITAFRKRFELEELYTDQKIVEKIIWKFVSFLTGGAIRERAIEWE
jgi:hypothetical protein